MAIPLSDMILLAVSFTGFGILTWTLYRLIAPKSKPRRLPNANNDEDNNNRAVRRQRQRIDQRRNNRRRAIAAVANDVEEPDDEVEDDNQNDGDDENLSGEEEEGNDEGDINVKTLSRKERAKAAKRAEREERSRYEEQRREELRQKKEEEEQEYLERRGRVHEEMELEREEEERLKKQRLDKERKEYEYWKKMFVIEESGECGIESSMENLVEYVKKSHIVDLDVAAEELGGTSKEIKRMLQRMVEEEDIFGVFDQRNRFIYFQSNELNELAVSIQKHGRMSAQSLLEEIDKVSSI